LPIEIESFKILKNGALQITWNIPSDVEGEFETISRKFHGQADPELFLILENLRRDVLEIDELTEINETNIEINSILFSYSGENKIMGAIFHFYRKLVETPGSKILIPTPKKFVEPINDALEPTNVFTENCAERVLALSEEIVKYIEGKRQQKDLFEEEGEDSKNEPQTGKENVLSLN